MVTKTISATQPQAVQVEPHGATRSDVWLRKNITQDAADNGPDGTPASFWTADEIHFVADGTPTAEELSADFDALWQEHEEDGASLEEQVAAARQLAEDNAAALLELGDIIGGE